MLNFLKLQRYVACHINSSKMRVVGPMLLFDGWSPEDQAAGGLGGPE